MPFTFLLRLLHWCAWGALLLQLSACSIFRTGSFHKEGASPEQIEQDLAECTYQIELNQIRLEHQFYVKKLCMQGKGYQYQTRP